MPTGFLTPAEMCGKLDSRVNEVLSVVEKTSVNTSGFLLFDFGRETAAILVMKDLFDT